MNTDRVLTQGEVELEMARCLNSLEVTTGRFDVVSREAAEAEADYKGAFARAMLHSAAAHRGDRSVTANEREAEATDGSIELLRIWKIKDAEKGAVKESLLSIRAHLDALRSLSANIRVQT